MNCLVNGVSGMALSSHDRGLAYGDGLFETLAVRNGRPLLWEAHYTRLRAGCQRLGIPAPDETLLRDEADRLCAGAIRAALKIMLTAGISERGYRRAATASATRVMQVSAWPDQIDRLRREGARTRLCDLRLARQPRLAGLKTLNRLEQVLARAEWGDEYDEGLLCDEAGRLISGVMSNLFLVRGDTLMTPDLQDCGIAGIMRAEVMKQTAALGLACREMRLTPTDMDSAEEVFVTNSLIGLWPVSSLGMRRYAAWPITTRLQQALWERCIG